MVARDPVRYKRLLDRLGEALDLPEVARVPWVHALVDEDPEFKTEILRILSRASSATLGGQVDAGVASLVQPDASELGQYSAHRPGEHVGDYILEAPLGEGGMGSVWRARSATHPDLPPVAVKLPTLAHWARGAAERLEREGLLLATLNHPNIARLIATGSTDTGAPYLVLEFVDGEPLGAYCDRLGLGTSARLKLFLQVLQAVVHAHASLVLHRDLKPSNVLVTARGEVKLLDFGIAKLVDTAGTAQATALTRLAGRAMTPDYASPEQIAGAPLTVASDVYSLGVMLFELLAGARPYRLARGTAAELEEAILSAESRRLGAVVTEQTAARRGTTQTRLKREISGDAETIVLKALKKKPADRYATAAAFLDDLERCLDGRPVLARPDSLAYRAGKFVARNRAAVGATAAIVLALAAGLAAALWQAQVAREQARVARAEAERAEQVKQFLVSMFEKNKRAQADAKAARDMNVADLLRAASQDIGTRFAGQPRLKAELLATTASMLMDLDETKRALELWREADAALGGETSAPADLRATILRGRAILAANAGQVEESRDAHRRMHALIRPENHPSDLLRLRVNAAVPGNGVLDEKQSLAYLLEALRIAESGFTRRPEYFEVLFELGSQYSLYSDWPNTAKYYARAVEVFESTGSKDFQNHAQALAMGAYALSFIGRMKDAIPMFDKGIAALRKHYGDDFNRTAVYEGLHAFTLGRHGETRRALEIYRRLTPPAAGGNGPAFGSLMALVQEASLHIERGDPRAALKALSTYAAQEQALDAIDSLAGMSHAINEAIAREFAGARPRADQLMAKIAGINNGQAAQVIGTNPEFRLRATQIALLRGDVVQAKARLAFGGGTFGPQAKFPPQFDEEFLTLNAVAAEVAAAAGDLDGAKAAIAKTRETFESGARPEDYPFLAATLYAAAGRIAAIAGDRDACLRDTTLALALQRAHHAPESVWKARTTADRARCGRG